MLYGDSFVLPCSFGGNYMATYITFCRVHQTLRITPAMAGGLSDHDWSYKEIDSLAG